MKEHYCTYEQSVKLKELGFDWKVNNYYTNGYANHDPEDITKIVRFHYDSPNNHNRVISAYGPCYSAPRLDQAAAWMRNCKGIDIEMRVFYIGNKRVYRPYIMPHNRKDYIAYPPVGSYESALEYGISTALELLGKEVKE